MRHRFRGLWFVLCAGLLASPAVAQERSPERVARLVERLGSNSYAERTAANRELEQLGSLPRAELLQAAQSPDAEIAARARILLQRIALDEIWLPGRVTLPGQDSTAALALESISQQSGNRLLFGARYGGFREANVHLTANDALFWEVIDDFCRQTKNHVRPHFDTRDPGLALVSGEPGANPVAYAGPLRASITGGLRTFSDEFDYKKSSSKQVHQFRLNLELLWEDRLRIVAYRNQLQLIEALTDSGQEISAAATGLGAWNVAGSGMRQVPLELKIEPPPTSARKFAVLALEWPVAAIGDFAVAQSPSVKPGEQLAQDDLELTIEAIEPKDANKHLVTVAVIRDRPLPDPPESLFQENKYELLDAQDRVLRLTEQSNSLDGRVVRSKLTFLGSSDNGPPAKLRVTYPRLRAERNMQIIFRDVPLPTARPE